MPIQNEKKSTLIFKIKIIQLEEAYPQAALLHVWRDRGCAKGNI